MASWVPHSREGRPTSRKQKKMLKFLKWVLFNVTFVHWSSKHVGSCHGQVITLLTPQLCHFASLEQREKELKRLGKVLEPSVRIFPQLGKFHSLF